MSVYLTADLHLGNPGIAERRGFSSTSEHDDSILHELSFLTKRDKLFILGDIVHKKAHLSLLTELNCTMDAILGNHDLHRVEAYTGIFNKVYGSVRYKNLWLSHIPIHPQEMYRCIGNLHGHIHINSDSELLPHPYYCVNLEFHDMKPVPFTKILPLYE